MHLKEDTGLTWAGFFMTLIDSFIYNIAELRTEIADAHHWQRHTSLLEPDACPALLVI
jgi:hypothetical protein